MKKHIYDESNGLSYTLHGDYYLPDLVVNEWVGLMNSIKACAEEIVLKERVYM